MDTLAGADPLAAPDTGAGADVLAGADALAGVDTDADADAGEDEDVDAGALWPMTGMNGSCEVRCPMARAPCAGTAVAAPVAWLPAAAGGLVAGAVFDGEVVLDDEPELLNRFGSWKASTTANKANRPTSRSFLRRSAALRAATRRLGMCLSIALMSACSCP